MRILHLLSLLFIDFATFLVDMLYIPVSRKAKAPHSEAITHDPKIIELHWIGHSTVYTNFFGVGIITDPIFSDRALLPKRKVAPSKKINRLNPIDIVLLSHSHFDHMDLRSLRKISRKYPDAIFVVPSGYARYFNNFDVTIIELPHGNTLSIRDVKIKAYKPLHWTNRYPWQQFVHNNAYLVERNKRSIFYAGDTAYSKKLQETFPQQPDIAVLPIGAYNPEILEKVHMTPEQAIKLANNIDAKFVLPVHFETFRLALEPMDEPRQRFDKSKKKLKGDAESWQIGQTVTFKVQRTKK